MQARMDALRTSNAALQQRNDELERQLSALGDGDSDALPRYDDQTQALVESGLHLGDRDVLSCTVGDGCPLHLTRAELGNMRQADFRRLQVLYREAYVKCLAACGNRYDLALPAVQRLVRLMKEYDAMMGALVLTQPDLVLHFLHGLDESVPITEVMAVCEASERKLRDIDVAEFLQLTDMQKDAIIQLRSEFMDRRVGVMAARTASILQACDIPTRGMADDPHQVSRSYLATDAAVKQLHRCLREQYSLGVQVETLFWSRILDPVQSARISLHTYPHHAHVTSIMDVVVCQDSRRERSAAVTAPRNSQAGAAVSRLLSAATQPIVEAMPG